MPELQRNTVKHGDQTRVQVVPIPAPDGAVRGRLSRLLDERTGWSFLRAPHGYDVEMAVRGWVHADRRRITSARWIRVPPGQRVQPEEIAQLLRGRGRGRVFVLDVTSYDFALDVEGLMALGRLASRVIVIARSSLVVPDHLPMLLDARLIGPAELAYTRAEVEHIVDGSEPIVVDRLMSATAGWPALVRLAASSEPATGAGSELLVADFVGELVSQLSPSAQQLLRATSVVAVSTAELSALLSEMHIDDIRRGWREISETGLAVPQLIDEDEAWEVLGVVREALRVRLTRAHGQGVLELHRRASQWYLNRGDVIDAIRQSITGQDWDTAAKIIEENGHVIAVHQPAVVRELLQRLPAETFEGRPDLEVIYDLSSHIGEGGPEGFPRTAISGSGFEAQSIPHTLVGGNEAIDRGMSHDKVGPGRDSLSIEWRESIAARHRGAFTQSLEFRTLLHARLDDRTRSVNRPTRLFLPMFHLQCGVSAMLAGELAQASIDLTDATHSGRGGLAKFVKRDAYGDLALLAAIEGDIPFAKENLTRMQMVPPIVGFWSQVVAFGELVAEALVATSRGDSPAAKRALDDAARTADRDELWAFYLLARAQHAVTDGSSIAALVELHRLRNLRSHLVGPDSAAAFIIPLAEAKLLLATDQAALAGAVLDAAPHRDMLAGMRVIQRVQIGELEQALALASKALWSEHAGPSSRALAGLGSAVASLGLGDRDTAIATFRLAHGLITRFEQRRVFGFVSRTSLIELMELSGLTSDLSDIVFVLPSPLPPVALSQRERVVLAQLATGSSLRAIASALFVSENTIRSQARSIYRKLGVSSRDAAITEAARRGISI